MATGGSEILSDEISDFQCFTCTNKAAVKYCMECQGYCCQGCVDTHSRFQVLKGHKLLDISNGQTTGSLAKVPSVPTERCCKHSIKILDMYCKDHDEVGCTTCMALDHSGWSPNDMEIFKRPMCLVTEDPCHALTISTEVISQLEMIDWPMVVVSVVGPYRTGKKYLLNRLAQSSIGFALGDSIESSTKGIWAYCKIHPEMRNTVLLLLDTEGLGDVEKGDLDNDNKIFTLATLLCNCIVYNIKGAFNQDAVNKLTFVTEMANNIRYRGESSEDNQTLNLILPDIVVCIRDFSLKLSKGGRKITDDEYLESSLEERKGKAEEFNKARKCIRKYFPQRKCFTFPVPGDGDILENLETLRFDQLSPKFQEATKRFTSYIYDKKPKELVVSKPVNGLMFATLAKYYVSSINHGAVPNVDDTFIAVAKIENAKIKKEAIKSFESQMEKIVLPVSASQLEKCYTHAQQTALNYLRKNVVHDNDGTFENDAQLKMDTIWNGLKEENFQKIKELCESKLQDTFTNIFKGSIERKVFEVAGGYRKFQRDMEKVKEEYFSSLRNFDEHEVLWPWIGFVKQTQGTELKIIQADMTQSQAEKEDEKKRNEEIIGKIIEQQKKETKQRLELQEKVMEAQYEHIVQERIKQMETEKNKFAALAEKKLIKETAQQELARFQMEQENKKSQWCRVMVSNASWNDQRSVENRKAERLVEDKKATETAQREVVQIQREQEQDKKLEDEYRPKRKTHQDNIKCTSITNDDHRDQRDKSKTGDYLWNKRVIDPREERYDKDGNPQKYEHIVNEKSDNGIQAAERHKPFSHTLKPKSASDSDVQKVERNKKYSRQTKQTSVAFGFQSIDQSNDSDSEDDTNAKDESTSLSNESKDDNSGKSRLYKIDTQAWRRCIDSKDIQEANRLVAERVIPDQDLLDRATDLFGMTSMIVWKICDSVCRYMKKNVHEIVRVYPAIDVRPKSARKNITFIIFTAQPSVIDMNGYHCYQRCLHEKPSSLPDENTVVKELEGVCQKDLSETERIREILNKHSKSLMELHTNISRLSISWVKSKGYGTENHLKEQKTCIAVYVQVKGFAPINEDILPSTIDGIDVDVREGLVLSYGGPNEHHECLKMGCAVHCGLKNADGKLLGGTLGGFFEYDSQLYCISCAHVFFSSDDMTKLKNNGPCDLGNYLKKFQARQPVLDGSQAFGEGIRAVYKEGGNGETGAEAVIIKMDRRLPVSGEFPDCPHKRNPGIEHPTFSTGYMYNRDEVNGLVRSKKLTVVKFGCSSGWTRGSIRFDGVSVRLHNMVGSHNDFGYLLCNQYEIESIGNTSFAEYGDSGALVFSDENDQLSVIGVVEGGMSGTVYVTPIFEVFLALGLPGVKKMKEFTSMQIQNMSIHSVDQVSSHNVPSRSDFGEESTWTIYLRSLEEKIETLEQDIPQEIAKHTTELQNNMDISITQKMSPVRVELNTLRSDISVLKSDVTKAASEIACAKRELKDEIDKSNAEVKQLIQNQNEMLRAIHTSILSQNSNPNTTNNSMSQTYVPSTSTTEHTHNSSQN